MVESIPWLQFALTFFRKGGRIQIFGNILYDLHIILLQIRRVTSLGILIKLLLDTCAELAFSGRKNISWSFENIMLRKISGPKWEKMAETIMCIPHQKMFESSHGGGWHLGKCGAFGRLYKCIHFCIMYYIPSVQNNISVQWYNI